MSVGGLALGCWPACKAGPRWSLNISSVLDVCMQPSVPLNGLAYSQVCIGRSGSKQNAIWDVLRTDQAASDSQSGAAWVKRRDRRQP
jgi:hypothetical protein